jgi:hypothetical protein
MTSDGGDDDLGHLAALARALPREIAPPPDSWARIAVRLEPRDHLDPLVASLPAEIAPPAHLWPAIEARIAPGRRARRGALAAAACLAVAGLVAVGVQLGADRDSTSIRSVEATRSEDAARAPVEVGWILDAPALAGDVAATLSRELALVRDERLRIERAIASEPDNVDLRELWAFTYETELQLADACGRTVMEYERERERG